MSGFSAEWLAMREPVDHASINHRVRDALKSRFLGRSALRVVDLGSGTGSNLRGLSPDLPGGQSWTLVDYDDRLLGRASAPPGVEVDKLQRDLSSGDISDLVTGADLVTASALFDLVAEGVIGRMVGQIAEARATFYTVLTYDGGATWLPSHSRDALMRAAFNRHQRSDKGFGPAAGPDATAALAAAFQAAGYRVTRGKSPWVLAGEHGELRRAVDDGWAGAVRETGELSERDVDEWVAHRHRSDNAVTIVGHEDLLAFPATGAD